MTTVTLGIGSRADTKSRFVAAMNGDEQGHFIAFETPALLFKVLNEDRWHILHQMIGAGPLTVDALASRVNRDLLAVQGDVEVLVNSGVLDSKLETDTVELPYDAIHVDFTLLRARQIED